MKILLKIELSQNYNIYKTKAVISAYSKRSQILYRLNGKRIRKYEFIAIGNISVNKTSSE